MSREERSNWSNTRSFFYGAEDAAKEAYDAMGQAIQEAEDGQDGKVGQGLAALCVHRQGP